MNGCTQCEDLNLVNTAHGLVQCGCVLKNRIKTELKVFLPAKEPTKATQDLIDLALGHDKSFFITRLPDKQHRPFFVSVLAQALTRHIRFRVTTVPELIQIYLGEFEEQSFYNFTQPWQVLLHGGDMVPNRREYNIIGQWIEQNKSDRRLLIYSDAERALDLRAVCKNHGIKHLET